MSRRVLFSILATFVILGAAAAALVLTSRPPMDKASDAVDAGWSPLATALDVRYDALQLETAAVRAALGDDRQILRDIEATLKRWDSLSSGDADAGVMIANRLEGLSRRLTSVVAASPRLRAAEPVGNAARAFEDAAPRSKQTAYNAAVDYYEDERSKLPRRLVAGLLGYSPHHTLELAS